MRGELDYDVIVVGAGPTGLTLALSLIDHGARVAVVERETATVVEPRAVTLDDESLRALATLSVFDDIRPLLLSGYGTRWYTGTGARLAQVSANATRFGYPCRSGFSQPELVALLARRVAMAEQATLMFETAVSAVEERSDDVLVRVTTEGDAPVLTAQFVVACDGANSGVRTRLGITLDGSSHAMPWLIVDTINSGDDARYSRFYCGDPRPYVAVPGSMNRMRYEFMLLPDEDPAAMKQLSSVQRLLADYGELQEADVVRIAVYRFHSRVAKQWRSGRVLLAGDAAHLMPPFAGQGMNSGIRDAFNLGWKLGLVCRGLAGERLLDTYERERVPHVRAMLRMSELIGRVVMSRGRVPALLRSTLLGLASRIPGLRDYVAEMRFKPEARFKAGFLLRGKFDAPIVGKLSPNTSLLAADGVERRFDAIVGDGFALVAFDLDGSRQFPIVAPPLCAALGARLMLVLPGERTPVVAAGMTMAADIRNEFSRALGSSEHIYLVRPDRIVAAVFKVEDVASVEEHLRGLLGAEESAGQLSDVAIASPPRLPVPAIAEG